MLIKTLVTIEHIHKQIWFRYFINCLCKDLFFSDVKRPDDTPSAIGIRDADRKQLQIYLQKLCD